MMKKILFVDDEKNLHHDITSLFPKEEFKVLCASDGLEGIRKCRNEIFDLIILDYEIPKLDGAKFYQQLRENQETLKIEVTPILYVTGAMDELKTKRQKWDRCDFLDKPFNVEELTSKAFQLMGLTPKVASLNSQEKIVLGPGEILYRPGDPATHIYFVLRGSLKAFKTNEQGEEVLVSLFEKGEVVGDVSVISGTARLMKLMVAEECELVAIPADKILTIVNGQSKWIKLILENLCRRLDQAVKRIS